MIYFTSDLHFGHRAILQMQSRPFRDVEEMNRVLLANFNSIVHKDDTVYILGDICHHMKVEDANVIISSMNGKKYLLIGNHDKKYNPELFEDMRDFMQVSLNGKMFSLMHYPMMSWPKKSHGSYHLHGHSHSPMVYNEANRAAGERRYDVGVDAHNFFPVSINQILDFFQQK